MVFVVAVFAVVHGVVSGLVDDIAPTVWCKRTTASPMWMRKSPGKPTAD